MELNRWRCVMLTAGWTITASLPTRFRPTSTIFRSVCGLRACSSQTDINLDKAIDINLYVGLTANSNLSLVQNNGMYAFFQQEEWRTNQTAINNPANAAWLLQMRPT